MTPKGLGGGNAVIRCYLQDNGRSLVVGRSRCTGGACQGNGTWRARVS